MMDILISIINLITGNLTAILIFTAVFLVASIYFTEWNPPKNLPPGPKGYPVIGNVLDLGFNPHTRLTKMGETYGDIFTVRIGRMPIVVLNGLEAAKEAFIRKGDKFTDRPPSFITKDIAKDRGILSTNGHIWREHRRFSLTTLRDFGMGKIALEDKIHEEIMALTDMIEKENGKAMDMKLILLTSVCNIIFSIVFGSRFEHNDPLFRNYMERLTQNLNAIDTTNLVIAVFPWMRHIPGDLLHYKRTLANVKFVEDRLQESIDEHRRTYDPDVTRDYIDAYLHEQMNRNGKSDESWKTFDDLQLLKTSGDFYVAGTETTSTLLRWTLLYMIHYPNIQIRLHEEIDRVIEDGRLPSMRDRTQLAIVDAVLNEVHRTANLTPTGVPHATNEDVRLYEYDIPKGTTVMVNQWNIHTDPKYWTCPEKFDPDRFLDEQGKLIKPDAFIPFSIGKRACVGESLAKMESFLFFTALMKKFKFLPEDEKNLPSIEGVFGTIHRPVLYKIRAVRR